MFKIKDWHTFQSYKDRSPPWIRLHKRLLDDFDYQKMSAEARALLPMLWLMASEDKDPVSGMLRFGYEVISFRLRQPEKTIKSAMAEIVKTGFIEEINQDKTNSYGTVTDPLRNCHSETETETETETDYTSDFETIWKLYPSEQPKGAKNKAFEKYKSIRKKHGDDEIKSGVIRYARFCKETKQYNQHMTTWLNGKGWMEEWPISKREVRNGGYAGM